MSDGKCLVFCQRKDLKTVTLQWQVKSSGFRLLLALGVEIACSQNAKDESFDEVEYKKGLEYLTTHPPGANS